MNQESIVNRAVAVEVARQLIGLVQHQALQEVEDLARIEIRKRSDGVVVCKLGGPAEVGLDGAPAQSFELDEAEVVLIPRSRRECVIFFSYA